MSLTKNAVKLLYDEKQGDLNDPIVQVLSIKKISPRQADKPDRYRLTISDGDYKHPSAMVATQLNELLETEKIKANSFIKVTKFLCNNVSDRRIIIMLGIEVVQTDVDAPIGSPVSVDTASAKPAAATPSSETKAASAADSKATKTSPENPYRKKAAAAASRPAAAASGGVDPTCPIGSLNPYNVRWVIRARVVSLKGRDYSNARGSGRMMSVDLVDESGEIRATAFNDTATKLEAMLEKNKVYVVKGGRIKPANKRFNTLNNDYEITFDESTTVTESQDSSKVPQQKFSFKTFGDLQAMTVNRDTFVTADILAVISQVNDAVTIMTRAEKEMTKRDIELVDKANMSINCTLWGDEATAFGDNGGVPGAVIAIKAAKVSDYGGRSLSVSQQSMYMLNPDLPEAHQLKGWYDSEGRDTSATSLTVRGGGGGPAPFVSLQQFKDATVNMDQDKPVNFQTTATVLYIKPENLTYQACPKCNKKVARPSATDLLHADLMCQVVEDNGAYSCAKCGKNHDHFNYRMLGSMSLGDHTGSQWMQMFQESGEVLLAAKANEIGTWGANEDPRLAAQLRDVTFKTWTLRCRAKAETYNEMTRMRVTINQVQPVNYLEESKRMLEEIEAYA